MKNWVIEKFWTTKCNHTGVVVINNFNNAYAYRCGYVGVSKKDCFFKVDYLEIEKYISIHGGVTFSGFLNVLKKTNRCKNFWFFGFDCAHASDFTFFNPLGIKRDLDFCVENCESLSSQLDNFLFKMFYKSTKNKKINKEEHNKVLIYYLSKLSDKDKFFVDQYFSNIGDCE